MTFNSIRRLPCGVTEIQGDCHVTKRQALWLCCPKPRNSQKQKLEETKKDPTEALEWLNWHLDFRIVASTAVGECISVVLSHLIFAIYHNSLEKKNTSFSFSTLPKPAPHLVFFNLVTPPPSVKVFGTKDQRLLCLTFSIFEPTTDLVTFKIYSEYDHFIPPLFSSLSSKSLSSFFCIIEIAS